MLVAAAALAAVLIGASLVGAGDADTAEPGSAAVASDPAVTPEPSLFTGIEQRGAVLGSPDAPVTLVEYADPGGFVTWAPTVSRPFTPARTS